MPTSFGPLKLRGEDTDLDLFAKTHAVGPRVADKPLAAQKADEGEAEFRGQLDGQARGGRNARHDREAGDQRLFGAYR